MSEELKQPVVDETQASAAPDVTVDSARNDGADLDSLLAQFETEAKKPEPVSPPQTRQQQPAQVDPNVSRLLSRFDREDLAKLVNVVKGDLDYDEDIVEAWIDTQARKDPRLQRAWLEREGNPKAFEQIARELSKSFAKRTAKRPDPALTEDREAVVAAVRGASTHRAPESQPPAFGSLSNGEFRNEVRSRYGFDPGV
jgi:hypothetical protein